MPSTAVQSPAKEFVEIVDDDDWLSTVENPNNATLTLTKARRALLGALWCHGTFADSSGRALAPLHEFATSLGYVGSAGAANGVFGDPSMAVAVERSIKGKRTLSVKLVALPRKWYDALQTDYPAAPTLNGDHATPEAAPEATPEAATVPPEATETPPDHDGHTVAFGPVVANLVAPTDDELAQSVILPPPDTSPPTEPWETETTEHVDLSIASTVAMALLTQVVEIISTGSPTATHDEIKRLERDYTEASQRLADRLADNDRLRRTIRELSDEIVAIREERDGLRRRLRQAESNLAKATSQDTQRFINERVQQELAKVMRSRPAGTHGRDDA